MTKRKMIKRKMTKRRKARSQSDSLFHVTTMGHLVPDGVHMYRDGQVEAGVHHIGTRDVKTSALHLD